MRSENCSLAGQMAFKYHRQDDTFHAEEYRQLLISIENRYGAKSWPAAVELHRRFTNDEINKRATGMATRLANADMRLEGRLEATTHGSF